MESQVQSSSDAGEKDVFCVRMYLLTMEMEVSLFMCVSVYAHVVKQGARQRLCFWAWGRPSGSGSIPGFSVAFQWKGAVSV